jgi:microsomal dipeptidase-like Zn-dependent dipeptidase
MKFLSDQVKANLEKEQQILKERTERERIEKDFHDAIEMQRENAEVLKKTISALEVSHANQLKDLGQKLDNANAAAQAAKEAAAAAQAQIAAMSKGKKKKWWKFW